MCAASLQVRWAGRGRPPGGQRGGQNIIASATDPAPDFCDWPSQIPSEFVILPRPPLQGVTTALPYIESAATASGAATFTGLTILFPAATTAANPLTLLEFTAPGLKTVRRPAPTGPHASAAAPFPDES